MRLKSIKLAGFKSFVDPTTVSFPSNMCSVVGPNGCGKSNIIDAVRWVMGESSAKTLRGESMADVIFNGTTSRQPVNQASIELLFDNSAGKIKGEFAAYNEISVRRLVTREGTSEYFLNNAKCRRRDITDLFLGTGLGPRSYAIIEQGMISRLIESRPEDLRVFIEEAAGISKYKERRKETESRMRRTVENLERLTDLREELERQLSHLQRQAQSAERYAEYKAEERQTKSELFAIQWRALNSEKSRTAGVVADLEVRQEALRADIQHCATEIERHRVAHGEATEAFNTVQADFYTVGGEVTRVEQALRFAQERREGVSRDLDQTRAGLAQASGHLQSDKSRLAAWQSELDGLMPALEQSRSQAELAATTLSEHEAAMERWTSSWETFNQRAAEPRQQSEVQQSRIVYLEQVLRRLQERVERLSAEQQSIAPPEDGADLAAIEAQMAEGQALVHSREAALEASQKAIGQQREVIESLRQTQDDARSKMQELRGQQSSLVALQEAATAADETETVQQWLQQRGASEAMPLLEQLDVESGWESAVEHVLSTTIRAMTVDDITAVLEGQDDLPPGLMLLNRRGQIQGEHDNALSRRVNGPAALADMMVGVLAVADLPTALAMRATLDPHQSVITPSGVWMARDWVRLPSAGATQGGVIERQAALDSVRETLSQTQSELDQIDASLISARDARAKLEQAHVEAQRDVKSAVRHLADIEAQLKTAQAAHLQAQEQTVRLETELSEAKTQFEQEQAALVQARGLLAKALDQMAEDGETRQRFQSERDTIQAQVQQSRDSARDARDEAHGIDIKVQGLRTQIQTVGNAIERLEQQVADLASRETALAEQLPSDADPDAELRAELETLLSQRLSAEEKLSSARQRVTEEEHALRQAEQAKIGHEHQLQTVSAEASQAQLQQAERNVRLETLERDLAELPADLNQVLSELSDEAAEAEWQVKVERVAARIARLGPINLAAIDECARASERKTYLDAQDEDLQEALSTLENAIKKIDRETRARFKETFDQVNAGFAELFPRVFGGGTACLEMTGDDLLDTGVAIMARPPGKKNSTIHLLSGGEKAMTAIALVFSIFQLNPAPFCMLDEVDAPLDDANVGRYARLVKEMSERVQFIFITHNKITMEAADQLMGVTMHEPGVSRLVSVDIEEAAQLAAS